jgi:hypothetical protein
VKHVRPQGVCPGYPDVIDGALGCSVWDGMDAEMVDEN